MPSADFKLSCASACVDRPCCAARCIGRVLNSSSTSVMVKTVMAYLANAASRTSSTVRIAPPPAIQAPALTSLYVMASTSAWNEASMMLSETPTVDQRAPSASSNSTSTRVTASVPPWNTRTR